MNIRNRKELKHAAASALAKAPGEKQIVAVYAGATALLALVVNLADLLLSQLISGTSGLSNMGTRVIWQTVQTLLPILQTVAVIAWGYGYRNILMAIRNGRTASPRDLPEGFSLLWPILRLTLLQYLIYMGLGILCVYVGTMIFLATPFASSVLAQVETVIAQTSVLTDEVILSTELANAVYDAIVPLMLIVLGLCAVVILPVTYSLRMTPYILLENPRIRPRYAMAASRRMMRRNRWQLFRLDLSLWWFYLLEMLAVVLCYGDMLLPLLGISLPFGTTWNYYLFFFAYLLAQFGISYAFYNSVEMIYIEAYEALKPRPQNETGVVLGNIFQM